VSGTFLTAHQHN